MLKWGMGSSFSIFIFYFGGFLKQKNICFSFSTKIYLSLTRLIDYLLLFQVQTNKIQLITYFCKLRLLS